MKFLLIALFATAASAMIAPLHTVKEKIDGSYIVVFNVSHQNVFHDPRRFFKDILP